MKKRIEKDALGEVQVPSGSYGGSFYTRAKDNFQISSLRAPASFRKALAMVKLAAARVNSELGHLDAKWSKAIQDAAEEFMDGRFDAFYDLDVYQAGAGTPFNMNLNEILANRANELLGGKPGEYSPIHPNDHVNMAQSSNDTIPSAIRIAALMDLPDFLETGEELVKAFEAKAEEFKDHLKVGRTHLQDAVPLSLGQEFGAYASAIQAALDRIRLAQSELMRLGIGGTAIGSGINTHTDFSKKMCVVLSELCGCDLEPASNKFETTHSMAAFASLSASIELLGVELLRITNDLRLMASGPRAGFNEIQLKEVEPGSSIMPGKVNPSVLECMSMICIQVMGLNHSVNLSAQQGQLELNWHSPIIMWDLLHEIEIMTNGMNMLRTLCIESIEASQKDLSDTLNRTTAMATALAPHMGYHEVAEIVNEALEKNVPFESLVPDEFKVHLKAESMTSPNRP